MEYKTNKSDESTMSKFRLKRWLAVFFAITPKRKKWYLDSWWQRLFMGRTRYKKRCTCGERTFCTIIKYTSSRGGMGIESGMGDCGKIRKQIDEANKYFMTGA